MIERQRRHEIEGATTSSTPVAMPLLLAFSRLLLSSLEVVAALITHSYGVMAAAVGR